MIQLLQPPRTILDVWKSLPEGTLCQIINNNIVMSPSPTDMHQLISGDIFYEMKSIIKKKSLGQIRPAPYDVHFSKKNILQPDIVFVLKENENLIVSKGLVGSPDIVVEILSPSTSHFDLGEKKDIYEFYGVKEYFIVDPANKKVVTLILEGKIFKEMDETIGSFNSKILGNTISF